MGWRNGSACLGKNAEHSPSPFVLVDFLFDHLEAHGFERLYERLSRLHNVAAAAADEALVVADTETREETPQIRAARIAFVGELLDFIEAQATWFSEHIARCYIENDDRTEGIEYGR